MPESRDVYLGLNEDVAKRLGVTPAGLRRLADIYGEVHGDLERDSKFNNRRLWTLEAVERLEAARALVQSNRARSIKAALLMLQEGTQTPKWALEGLSQEVSQEGLLVALLEHVQRLEAQIEAMQRQLEAPKDDHMASHLQEVLELNRALVRQVMGPDGTNETAELRRMNEYLLGELERRRGEDEAGEKRRPWWQFWKA